MESADNPDRFTISNLHNILEWNAAQVQAAWNAWLRELIHIAHTAAEHFLDAACELLESTQQEVKQLAWKDRGYVPFGKKNEKKLETVVTVWQYLRSTAPYPPERTKKILKKADIALS